MRRNTHALRSLVGSLFAMPMPHPAVAAKRDPAARFWKAMEIGRRVKQTFLQSCSRREGG